MCLQPRNKQALWINMSMILSHETQVSGFTIQQFSRLFVNSLWEEIEVGVQLKNTMNVLDTMLLVQKIQG